MEKKMTTVGKYFIKRLEQAGLKDIFGVPGDYVLTFFDRLEDSKIKVITNCNELNAGYAADAYARIKGLGAVCVTYGVGGFSLFNAVVGAYSERIPLVVISGAPKVPEREAHHLLHHTIGDMKLQEGIYRKVTAASTVLTNPEQAPAQIDETISACMRSKRPVYIEIPMDMVDAPCSRPGTFKIDTVIKSDPESLKEAVLEAAEMLKKAKRPAILAGVEAHRLGLRKDLQKLVDHSGYPFASSLLAKSVIPEEHAQFAGVYGGVASWESAMKVMHRADAVLSLGTLVTDIQLGGKSVLLEPHKIISANSDSVRIKHHIYENVSLRDFIHGLLCELPKRKPKKVGIKYPYGEINKAVKMVRGKKITLKRFYQRMNRYINGKNIIVADTGDSIFSASKMFLPKGTQFIDQAFYLSIGYATPAALGVNLAAPDKRTIAFVGDGAFQMTAQEVSTIIRNKLNPIIFIVNNDGYLVERVITDGAYNDLHMWNYYNLPELFNGGWGARVKTEDELESALEKAAKQKKEPAFIEIMLDKWDCSDDLLKIGKSLRNTKAKKGR